MFKFECSSFSKKKKMWHHYLLISALALLANRSVGGLTTTVVTKSEIIPPTIYELLQEHSNADENDTTRFTDADVQFVILDCLNLTELLDVVKINSNLSLIVGKVFRHKYRDFEFHIALNNVECENNQNEEGYSVDERAIETITQKSKVKLIDCKLTVDILMHFGRFMRKLTIENDDKMNIPTINIIQIANDYIADTVVTLNLPHMRNDTLKQFTRPFKGVRDLNCEIKVNQTGTILPFNKLFPELQKISISLQLDLNYSYIDCKLPHLEHLSVKLYLIGRYHKVNEHYEGFLQKNQQIQSINVLGLGTVPEDYIAAISKLSNVEKLTFMNIQVQNQTIHFESIKHFKYRDYFPQTINKFIFPRLETIVMTYDPKLYNKTLEFFENHRNLSKLELKIVSASRVPLRLDELMMELSNLREIILQNFYSIDIFVISKIIQNHENLEKLTFWTRNYRKADIRYAFERFEHEWNIEQSTDEIRLTKKSEAYNCSIDAIEMASNVEVNNTVVIPSLYGLLQENYGGKDGESKFANLNVDVQLFIFNHLNLTELLNVTKNYPKHSSIACETFRTKYQDYVIEISQKTDECDSKGIPYFIPFPAKQSPKSIKIIDCQLAVDVLQHFGNYMNQLSIDDNNNVPHSINNIDRMANEFASESITCLNLHHLRNDTLKQFTKPFKRVRELNCEIEVNQTEHFLRFNEIFPELRKLTLTLRLELNYTYFDCEFSHLKQLVISTNSLNPSDKINVHLVNLLRKNQQIESFELTCIGTIQFDYVRVIGESLLNLVNLTLNNIELGNETLRFESVEHLNFVAFVPYSINRLLFARLKSIQMNYHAKTFNETREFFRNHQNLSKLQLNLYGTDGLIELIANLENLTEITLIGFVSVRVDLIIGIVQNHDSKMTKIEFPIGKFRKTDFKHMHKLFGRDWRLKISKLHYNHASMQRRDLS